MIGRAAALTNLGDKDRAFRAKKQAFGSFFRFSPCRCALMRRKLRQRQIPSFGRRMVRVCRETDFSGCCFARKYDGMRMPGKASLCHPCRQPSAPACGVPRRRNGSRAQRRQRQVRRECRNEDFSGCYFARKYNCMGTPKKSLPLSPVSPAERTRLRSAEAPQRKPRAAPAKAGSEGMSKRGFLRLLLRPKIQLHGDAEKKPPFVTRVASRAHPLAECRGAATEAARSAGKGRFGGNVETRISPAVTSPGNTTAWGRRRNPTARGSCSPRSGGKAP